MYVWGWVPGIYVQAQRMSPTPKAFEGTMHTLPPQQLADRVQEILKAFEKNPPKFIVDTRKIHFPWTRPPLELWPLGHSRRRQRRLPARRTKTSDEGSSTEFVDAKLLKEQVARPWRLSAL